MLFFLALTTAYEGIEAEQPNYFVYFSGGSFFIDVNIHHPAEIKFEDEQNIFNFFKT